MSTPSQRVSPAGALLQRQLKEINTANDLSGISVGLLRDSNVFEWEVSLMINDDCKYYGGTCSALSPSLSPSLPLSLLLPLHFSCLVTSRLHSCPALLYFKAPY